ncbi:MAG TPA: hypothetical protein VFG83_13545 [Kofleriaceae bacterium]|nr:hypothetical protein [Kofleriaceae bacterium]
MTLEQKAHLAARQIGTMALSHVSVDSAMALVRAAAWHNALARLGLHLPLCVVHDLGILLTTPAGKDGRAIRTPRAALAALAPAPESRRALDQYAALLSDIAASEVAQRLAGWRLRDDLVAVLLTRALGDVANRIKGGRRAFAGAELPLDPAVYAAVDPIKAFRDTDTAPLWLFFTHLVSHALHIYTQIELIDLDTVKLLGLFREDSVRTSEALASAVDVADLLSAMSSPDAGDVANFSLDLLPSVLETKRASGPQIFSVDGYTSIERKGNIDSLMLSELAQDREIFEHKVVHHELYYFGHERQREDERRLQYILVDSSASMRGRRQVFARGLALTLAKKLTLQGDEVWFRFFDARLHEIIKTHGSGGFPVPYLLSFRSEQGRNYGKVFRRLLVELSRARGERGRHIVVYIITHGQCHIDPDLVSALAQQATLYGVFILPSSELSLDFVPLLHRHQVVDGAQLASRQSRKGRALDIVDDATQREHAS